MTWGTVFYGDPVHHKASLDLFIQFDKSTGCCGAHSLAEVYSTLTRMPGKHRISAEQEMLFIGSIRERLSLISLNGDEASSEESVGEGERQGWLSTRNLRSFLQVESARQNATFIFGRERRETRENVGHVKLCCNNAPEVEDMKHSRLVGLFVALLGVLALFSSLNKPGVAALRGSEVVGLLGSGGCFGVGLAGLLGKLRVRD